MASDEIDRFLHDASEVSGRAPTSPVRRRKRPGCSERKKAGHAPRNRGRSRRFARDGRRRRRRRDDQAPARGRYRRPSARRRPQSDAEGDHRRLGPGRGRVDRRDRGRIAREHRCEDRDDSIFAELPLDERSAGRALARHVRPPRLHRERRTLRDARRIYLRRREGDEKLVLLTLGTGIGGGIISEGTLLLGNAMGAGEFGHHTIRPVDGFVCGCGKIGCFEAQASGTGLMRHALALAPSFPRSTLLDLPREKWGSKMIRKAAAAGDGHGLAAWNRWIDDLAIGLSNIIAFVNPEVIALGGGVSSAGDFLVGAVVPKVEERTTMVPRGTTRIVIASLINDAGAVGAATMAFRGGLTTGAGAP